MLAWHCGCAPRYLRLVRGAKNRVKLLALLVDSNTFLEHITRVGRQPVLPDYSNHVAEQLCALLTKHMSYLRCVRVVKSCT